MRNGIAISTLLHFGVVLAAVYGLPDLLNPPVVVEQPIIVELVTIAERTVSQKPVEPQPKKPPPPAPKLKPIAAPEPKPEPAVAKAPPPPPPPPEPAKVEAPAPPKPAPKAKPAEVVTPKPKPAEKPKPKAQKKPAPPKKIAMAEPPKAFRSLPRPKQKPKRRRPKFSADRIAALLDKAKKDDAPEVKKEEKKKFDQVKPPEPKQPAVVSATAERQEFGQPLTISEVDAVRAKIETCWSMPAGARGAENFVVRIQFALNPDGSFRGAPKIIDSGGHAGNEAFYRTASEAALRAVQKCEPYDMLPRAKYKRWQDMEMTFDPKEMMGG